MKTRILILLALFNFITMRSQILMSLIFGDKLNSKELSFGIHLDQSWNTMSNTESSSSLTSFNLGLFFNYMIDEHWRGNLEMLAKYQRGASDLPVYPTGDSLLDTQFMYGNIDREINYLSLPISIQYVTKPGIYAEIGPQISLRFKAKDIFNADINDEELRYIRDIKDETTNFDLGWLAGIGYYIGKAKTTSIGFRYYGGFTDVMKNIENKQHHNQWAIYANIPIGRHENPED
ncbi:outer membrane beta-barrel protein [Robertkochia solimangrovi]|uniref:outer membrane beta-barrel protein n=1 Tax=Robertkochia solimangrovi TaxID=2213046 RepID=UPI00117DEB2D|nr:outer membrane beta-barrel protein [Robertkochia solimangrovi]TRZ41811.1 hypothetical protein DMZ48_15815 [Robertkochia solimangrovi]